MILIEERRLSFYEARQREGISAIKIEVTKSIAHAQGRLHSRLSL